MLLLAEPRRIRRIRSLRSSLHRLASPPSFATAKRECCVIIWHGTSNFLSKMCKVLLYLRQKCAIIFCERAILDEKRCRN
jgi:hypothetical protein